MGEHPCPECGGTEWTAASDGLGDVASVASVCHGCGYITSVWVSTAAQFESAPAPESKDAADE